MGKNCLKLFKLKIFRTYSKIIDIGDVNEISIIITNIFSTIFLFYKTK